MLVKSEMLWRLRMAQDMTQTELAAKVGVSSVSICKWESGKLNCIKMSSAKRLAKALRCKPTDLAVVVNGEALKAVRKKRGWSQQCLADFADVSRELIWRIEYGKSSARWATVEKLVEALECSIDDIATEP